MNIALRTACDQDVAFARGLYFDTMREIITQLFGWDQRREEDNFARFFKLEEVRIITADGQDVGWIQEQISQASIHLGSFYIRRTMQSRGIGTQVLRMLLERAARESKTMTLAVVKINPARKFYEKCGFRTTHEDEYKIYMSADQITFGDKMTNSTISTKQREEILERLQTRFEKNMNRHKGLEWAAVRARLEGNPKKLWSLTEMERTGGEPDVVGHDKKSDEYIFYDCCEQSPKGRRSLCYDREALESRKEHKPKDSAVEMATTMGIEILTEEQYRHLQTLGVFDTAASSWVKTPSSIRKLGGALFCDRRYDTVFVYHNGAESYYAARGFRGALRI